mgnify:FL=1
MCFNVKVTLQSKDGHTFVVNLKADSIADAENKARQFVEEKGWSDYEYKVTECDLKENEIKGI